MSTIPVIQEDVEKMIGDRYTIEGLAGNGGFGDVYRGYDNRMCREVAIKVVKSLGDREADVLLRLDHRGMPVLYDVIRGEEITVMIMEWIPGVDLEKYISGRGTLSEKTVIKIGTELLEILDYLHSHSPAIIYQDLKPSNIMIMPGGHVKLVDFGTALVMDYGDEETILAGTVGYGAPEQRGITGQRHASAASDLYAWGAVMYTMLSGIMLNKPPYTMKKVRTVCPGISYGLSHVISKCTKRNEKDRFQDAKSVLKALGHQNVINAGCKTVFTGLFILCAVPFPAIWLKLYISGGFDYMRLKIHTVIWLMMTGDTPDLSNLRRTAGYIFRSDRMLKITGLMILTAAWCFLGIRLLQTRKFMKIRRSLFLSRRKYPGLWIPTLIAGVILGCGLGGDMSTVSMAKETAPDTEKILPVSFVSPDGENLLLRYEAPFDCNEDLCLKIDSGVLAKYAGGSINISISSKNENRSANRQIPLTGPDPDARSRMGEKNQ